MKINWESIVDFYDIKYERGMNDAKGIVKITINRPEVRNSFRPKTVFELKDAFKFAREDQKIGVIIKDRMEEIVAGTEKTFGAKIELDYEDGYPPTINDPVAAEKLLSAAREVVGDGARDPYLSMGAEDFSYFLQKVPGCYFLIGSAPQDREPLSVPHHCSI